LKKCHEKLRRLKEHRDESKMKRLFRETRRMKEDERKLRKEIERLRK